MRLLKEEINQNGRDMHTLAKWKFSIVAAVAVVGLGWKDFGMDTDSGLLLICSIGFFCSYIDWFIYKKYISVHTIAKFIQSYDGNDDESNEIKRYENWMKKQRKNGDYYLSDRWPNYLASLIACIGLTYFAYIKSDGDLSSHLIVLSLTGIASVSVLFFICCSNRKKLDQLEVD